MILGRFFLFRFPALTMLVLVLLPVVALTGARDMLGNLFVLGPWGFFWITVWGLWCGWSTMVVTTLIARYGPARFDHVTLTLGPRQRAARRHRHGLFGALGAGPTLVAALLATHRGNPEPPWLRITMAIVLGVLVALVLAYVAQLARQLLVSARTEHDNLLFPFDDQWQQRLHRYDLRAARRLAPWRRRIARRLGPGFYDPQHDDFEPGHLMALAVILAVAAVYLSIGLLTRPGSVVLAGFPALGYLLSMILFTQLLVSVVGFYFDRWRVPTLLLLLTVSLVGYLITDTDHAFATVTRPHAPVVPTPSEALDAWRQDFGAAPPRLVVVAASGGGITAASWATHVLTGLEGRTEDDLGRRFSRSLAAISAVSGGSVGTTFYLSGFERGVARHPRTLRAVREAAAASSLRAVAWGMAYPDIWRFFFAPLAQLWPEHNRAWALEHSWLTSLRALETPVSAPPGTCGPQRLGAPPAMSQETLQCLARRVRRGQIPVPLLNTTQVETGEAMIFAPVDLPAGSRGPFAGYGSFLRRWPHHDVPALTATRISASFPWVTPVARAPSTGNGRVVHLADGGYFDNAGLATLVEWLALVLERAPWIEDVLVIRIDAAKEAPGAGEGPPGRWARYRQRLTDGGWAAETLGPIRTLMRVRGATQSSRNLRALDLLRQRWASGPRPVRFSVACFLRSDRGLPLSWKLTGRQQQAITVDWQRRGAKSPAYDLVGDFLRGTTAGGETAGCEPLPGHADTVPIRDTIAP